MMLEEYNAAEEALSQSNLLDFENSTTWAYLTLFCLKVNRKNQAIECLNELFKIKEYDLSILFEIAKNYERLEEYKIAYDIYNKISKDHPNNLDAIINMSDLLYRKLDKQEQAVLILDKYKIDFANEEDAKRIDYLISNLRKDHFNDNNFEEVSLSNSKSREFLEENNYNNDNHSNNFDEMDDFKVY